MHCQSFVTCIIYGSTPPPGLLLYSCEYNDYVDTWSHLHVQYILVCLVSLQIYAEGSEDVPASSATALEYFKGAAKKVGTI